MLLSEYDRGELLLLVATILDSSVHQNVHQFFRSSSQFSQFSGAVKIADLVMPDAGRRSRRHRQLAQRDYQPNWRIGSEACPRMLR
jgi:hypothetical protein